MPLKTQFSRQKNLAKYVNMKIVSPGKKNYF